MSNLDALKSTSAVGLTTSAILSALIHFLKVKGLLSKAEEMEIYEFALQLLETAQEGESIDVAEAARELIEKHLRPS